MHKIISLSTVTLTCYPKINRVHPLNLIMINICGKFDLEVSNMHGLLEAWGEGG